jgi:hypothetical protein
MPSPLRRGIKMADLLREKLEATNRIPASAVVSEEGDYYLLDFLPCSPYGVLRVRKEFVAVGPEKRSLRCPDGREVVMQQIRIQKNSEMFLITPTTTDSDAVKALLESSETSEAFTGAGMPNSPEAFGIGTFVKCLPCRSNPFYWQAVGLLKIAKEAGLIRDRTHCNELTQNLDELAGIIAAATGGSPPAWAVTVLGWLVSNCADCACRDTF